MPIFAPLILAVAIAAYEMPEQKEEILNPIDSFFLQMDDVIDFQQSTMSMVLKGFFVGTAWRAELENFYEILAGMTKNDFVRETLSAEIYHFRQYIQHRAEISAMLDASNAFWGNDEDLGFGSLGGISRSWSIARSYREKALELLERLQLLTTGVQFLSAGNSSDFSFFVFNLEEFYDWMKAEFPGLWR